MKKIIILFLLTSQSVVAQERVIDPQFEDLNAGKLKLSHAIAQSASFHSITKDKKGRAKAALDRTYIAGDQIFLRMKVNNRSAISYDLDFIKFFIRDRKTAKRTITQEQEIVPVDAVTAGRVAAGKKQYFVFALEKFTLADDKILCSEVYEKGGGRHLQLTLKDRDLNRARPFSKISP